MVSNKFSLRLTPGTENFRENRFFDTYEQLEVGS